MKPKYELAERPICNAVNVFRERGNYLQRLELFENSIAAYNEALRWNSSDIRSLIGRSIARAKSTHYTGALADVARAAELEPDNPKILHLRAQTEYERCAFERAWVLANRGQCIRKFPPDLAECARCAEETIIQCSGETATKTLESAKILLKNYEIKRESVESNAQIPVRRRRIQPPQSQQILNISRSEEQRARRISCLMASKYLGRMKDDKYFLTDLAKDERLMSANVEGSRTLQLLANTALADLEKRKTVLHERCPMYNACAFGKNARARLARTRQELVKHTQIQHANIAKRLIEAAEASYKIRDTTKCLEHAEFGLEQINKISGALLPGKENYLKNLYDIVGNAFLDQKRVRVSMSESNRERRAFILLGMTVSREPSRDSILRVRPQEPRRDHKTRRQYLERMLSVSTRDSERCYLLHELARLHIEMRQPVKGRTYAQKCKTEATECNKRIWLLNALFLLARCHLLQHNRPEARNTLLSASGIAYSCGYQDIAEFFTTCANISLEGEFTSATLIEKRQKDFVSLMPDEDSKTAAKYLFRRMSSMPANRRFSVLPGAQMNESASYSKRRMSIMQNVIQPAQIKRKSDLPLGFQDFDY